MTNSVGKTKGKKACILKERMGVHWQKNPRHKPRRVWALLKREGWLIKKSAFPVYGGRKALTCPTNSAKGDAS
jgi:hypothetical protein